MATLRRAGPHTDRVVIVCDECGAIFNRATFDPAGACEHIKKELEEGRAPRGIER